jgi:ubiquinone/menaquinone biosynthesis C-methylase UbiE
MGVEPFDLLPVGAAGSSSQEPDSLFERVGWLYAFFREHLFRDDTNGIAAALWPRGAPPEGSRLVELGCGPGFYCCRFAERFRNLRVLGLDRSNQQLRRARRSARSRRLENCTFERADALALAEADDSVDALLAVRLFTILPSREVALGEMYRVLRPGGRCFIAEPCSRLRAAIPLRLMWIVANLMAFAGDYRSRVYREPPDATVLSPEMFAGLVMTQPWGSVWRWQDPHYQYAICEKGPAPARVASRLENEDYTI